MTRTLSIAIKENTYQNLKQKIGAGKISSFVNQAVEKELKELFQTEKNQKEQLRQQLVRGYQDQAKNRKLQKMLQTYGEMSWEDISIELVEREKNVKAKK
jgi:DNA gyrase/topoisomerase IV subunit B